ncbi:MAG: hypothetical protein GX102_14190 [Porphyromonadaceae bacterium]|nr:hypothetical protein [Porphyromonadaceae bacterium]
MKNIIGFVATFLILTSFSTQSQTAEMPVSVLTPNASGLGLYGDIPVSLYTGTPEISIPLYEIKEKSFTLPITLSYHAAGVQADQHPGWVGLGWNLLSGGLISRKVNDLPDEFDAPGFRYINNGQIHNLGESGYYFNYEVLNTDNWNNRSYLQSIAQDMDQMLKDTEPDEFYFSFNGYSGKFCLDHNGNWVVQSNLPLKIVFDDVFFEPPFEKKGAAAQNSNFQWPKCFNGFTIIVEDGTKYVFGKNINAIDFSIDFFNQDNEAWIATAWYLTKIILPWGEDIVLNYERHSFTNQMYIAVNHDLGTKSESNGSIYVVCESANVSTDINRYYVGKLLSPVYLTAILSPSLEISFVVVESEELRYGNHVYSFQEENHIYNRHINTFPYYYYCPFLPYLKNSDTQHYPEYLSNLQWHELEIIEIKSRYSNSFIKTISFHYNNSPNHRLRLDSITNQENKTFKFEYYNIDNMPPYLANKSDHWGYYNGTFAKLNDINYFSYRESNSQFSKYGVLEKITYPTGGYTQFEFETHDYRKQLNEKRWETPIVTFTANKSAGGARIKTIKHFSDSKTTPDITKEYYYVSDYLQNGINASQSSGVLGGQVKYSFNYTVKAFNHPNMTLNKRVFSSISVLPACNNANNNHVGYSEVIERLSNGSFSLYRFTNFDNGYMDESADEVLQLVQSPYEPYVSRAMERGKMVLKEDFDSIGRKIFSSGIEYERMNSFYIRSMRARFKNVCLSSAVCYDEGSSYKMSLSLLRPKTETDTFFNPLNGIARQTVLRNLTYNHRKLLQSLSNTNSDGVIYKTEYKYPFDYLGNSVLNQMTNLNILSPIIEQAEYKNTNEFLSKKVVEYKDWGNNIYLPEFIKTQNKKQNSLETQTTFHNISSVGNTVCLSNNDNVNTVYLWSYKGRYLIAEIKNSSFTEVENAVKSIFSVLSIEALSNLTIPNENKLKDGSLQLALPNAHITTYTHYPHKGVSSITDQKRNTTFFEYDDFDRLKRSYIIENDQQKTIETYNYHYKTN